MARSSSLILDQGSAFPQMEFQKVEGGIIRLPDDWSGSWALLIAYRGHW